MPHRLRSILACALAVALAVTNVPVVCSAPAPAAQPVPRPPVIPVFYRNLVDAIESVQVRVLIELKAGVTTTSMTGVSPVEWTIQNGCKLTLVARYKDGVLVDATAGFEPFVTLRPAPQSPLNVKSIGFNADGVPTSVISNTDAPILNDFKAWPSLVRQFEFSHTAANVLMGAPFATLSPAAVEANTTIIARLRLLKENASRPGFQLTLKDHARLELSAANAPDSATNYLVVARPTSVELDEVELDFVARRLTGRLVRFDATTYEGVLGAGGLNLRLGLMSALTISSVDFAFPSAGPEIQMRSGTLRGSIGLGSTIVLAADPLKPTVLTTAAGSIVALQNLSIDLGSAPAISFETGHLALELADARIPLGAAGYLLLRNGELAATVKGAWSSGHDPAVTADIHLLATDVYAGSLLLGGERPARLHGGTFRSTALKLNTASGPTLYGTISALVVDIEHGNDFDVSTHLRMSAGVGARIAADDVQEPLTIRSDGKVIGRAQLFAPFTQVRVEDNGALRDGIGSARLRLLEDGSVEASNVTMRGRAAIAVNVSDTIRKTLRADVALENGSWGRQNGQIAAQYDVDFSMQAPGLIDLEKFDYPVDMIVRLETPHFLRTRLTIFPVRFTIDLYREISLPRFRIRRLGDSYTFLDGVKEVTAYSRIRLMIPPRLPNGYGSDDRQEVLRARCFVPEIAINGSHDLQVYPGDVEGPLTVSLKLDNGKPKITVHPGITNIPTQVDLCNSDGIALIVVGTVAVVGILSLAGIPALSSLGTVGTLMSGVVGGLEGFVTSYIKGLIESTLANLSFDFSP